MLSLLCSGILLMTFYDNATLAKILFESDITLKRQKLNNLCFVHNCRKHSGYAGYSWPTS